MSEPFVAGRQVWESRLERQDVKRPTDPVLELIHAAQALHDEYAEYGRVNNLGGYDNHNMRRIRAAIDCAWRAAT